MGEEEGPSRRGDKFPKRNQHIDQEIGERKINQGEGGFRLT